MKIKLVLLALLAAAGLTHAGSPGTAPLKTAVNPGHLADTRAYGYSQATVVAPGARVIYIAGQVGVAADGPNDFETQVDRAFDNLLAVLAAAGGRVDDIVKITLLVKHHDAARLDYLKRKRRQMFGENPPASTLIPVPALATDAMEFEIDAIAIASR